MRAVLAALAVLFVVLAFGMESQQPSTNASHKKSSQQERGSEQSPIVVKIVPPEISKDERDKMESKEADKATEDRQMVELTGALARYTKWLFVATTVLAMLTLGLVIVGFKQTSDARASIEAAKKSAVAAERQIELGRQEFSATHRPRIILREAYTAFDAGHPMRVSFTLANTGGTQATIVNSKFSLSFSTMNGAKRQVKFDVDRMKGEVSDVIDSGKLIEAGSFYEGVFVGVDCEWPKNIPTVIERSKVVHGGVDWHYYFFGKISYKDGSDITRNMAFYRVLDFESFRFVPYNDSQLEYSDERP